MVSIHDAVMIEFVICFK